MNFDFSDVNGENKISEFISRDLFHHLIFHHGLCVLPALPNEKRPALSNWRKYTSSLPTSEEVDEWTNNKLPSRICIVCGAVSGGLECLDFDDGGSAFQKWREQIPDHLYDRLFIESTPSGGIHCWYRLADAPVPANRKIAKNETGKALIETRGEGGLALCSPSPEYEKIQGHWETLPFLTADEYETICIAAQNCDETPAKPVQQGTVRISSPSFYSGGDSVISKFNQTTDVDQVLFWLERMGWDKISESNGNIHLRRPGKAEMQTSASLTMMDGVKFKVFTTSDPLFPASSAGESYSAFDIYARYFTGNAFYDVKDVIRDFCRIYKQETGMDYIEQPKVDLSGLFNLNIDVVDDEEDDDEPIIVRSRFENLPNGVIEDGRVGFIKHVMEYLEGSAYVYQPEFFLSTAMVFLSTLTAQMYETARRTRGNLYHVHVGRTGCGKDFPRTFIMDSLIENGLEGLFAEDYASPIGLQNDLRINKVKVWLWDEMGMAQKYMMQSPGNIKRELINSLLVLFNKSGGVFKPAVKADISNKEMTKNYAPIYNPYLCLMGSSTPDEWFGSMNMEFVTNGFFGRIQPFYGLSKLPKPKDISHSAKPVTGVLQDEIRIISKNMLSMLQNGFNTQVVRESEDVVAELNRFNEEVYEEMQNQRKEWYAGLWSRAVFMADKYAMIRAIARDWREPIIRKDDILWGVALSRLLVKRKCGNVETDIFASEYDRNAKRIINYIKSRNGVTKKQISNGFRDIKKSVRDEILNDLLESKTISRDDNKKYWSRTI